MFFLDRANFVFLLSFPCVGIASIFAILSQFGFLISPNFGKVERKWLYRCLGVRRSRVQFCEFCVFFFSVLSANLTLLARVYGGVCSSAETKGLFNIWFLQDCNPRAEVSTSIVVDDY
jgi:hypothetical protein